jgi:hypothetical protein
MEQQSSTLVSQIGYFHSNSRQLVAQAQPAEVVRMPAQSAAKPKRPAAAVRSVAQTKPAPAPLARASGDDTSWSEF